MKIKYILACSIGTILEWAEFTYYGYLALLFAKLFFPNLSNDLSIGVAFFAFAMSYIARPLGAVFFGWVGDRLGRRRALLYSLMMMGGVTICMGLLPTYESIGIVAPALLFFLRFLQGIAISGELTGAAIYLMESLPKRPYFYTSFASTSSALGMFVGVLCAYVVSLPHMPGWAWRVPFIAGSLSCLLGLYIRRYLQETLDLTIVKKVKRLPIRVLFEEHKFAFMQTLALSSFVGIYIYTCNLWWVSFSIENHYFDEATARQLGTIAQGCVVIFTPVIAFLADWKLKNSSLIIGLLGSIILTPLLFSLTRHHSFGLMLWVMIGYALINACVTSIMFKYMADLFPKSVRYTGMTFSWSVAIAFFAGFAPLIAQAISDASASVFAPAYYVVFSALVALTVLAIKP